MGKFYITTSIAYVNAEPHIGFAQEMLAADVISRYHRNILGDDTYFLTGTDEHGLSVQTAADKAGMKPKEFVDKMSEKYRNVKEMLNLENDGFVRTTDPEHVKNVLEIWNKALEAGYIYKKSYEGLYCVGCEVFLNVKDLVDGKCPNHPTLEPQKVQEENWFFKLSAFEKWLKEFYEKNPDWVTPKERFSEIKSFVNSGLEDISVSRPKEKVSWGIELPNDKDHVMYVWFDALINYLYPKKYWPADLHVIGKDILRFHAAIWPAMLKAAGYEDKDMPKRVHVHGFISVEGKKMSKTLGNVVKPQELIEKYGLEATRYLLLRELSFEKDSDFSWARVNDRYNADLANDLGNLLQRTLTMINKYEVEIIDTEPDRASEMHEKPGKLIADLKFNDALGEVWKLIQESNRFIETSKPWELAKSDKAKLSEVLNIVHANLKIVAEVLMPFMPETADKMKKQLTTNKPEPLFPRFV